MRWDMLDMNPEELASALASFCFASRPVIKRYFKQPLVVTGKADNSPVTIADQSAEAEIRAAITAKYPSHNIIGEEHGGQISGAFDWVIDPIDGTRAFICGKPLFGTLIALCHQKQAVASVIDMPMLDEIYVAVAGHGATLNGKVITTSGIETLAEARISSTAPEALDDQILPAYLALSRRCLTSGWGGDCYNYALLASGHLDLVIEHQLASHDIMALVPVIEEAGGVITDFSGRAVQLGQTTEIIAAASKALHDQAMMALQLRG